MTRYPWSMSNDIFASAVNSILSTSDPGGRSGAEGASWYSPLPANANSPSPAIIYHAQANRDLQLLEAYRGLKQDWDGYDADPISSRACEAARTFLTSLPHSFESPDLCPNPSGTISMEWQSSEGEAQLEIGRSKYSFYMRRRGLPTVYHNGASEGAAGVYGLLRALYEPSGAKAITTIEL